MKRWIGSVFTLALVLGVMTATVYAGEIKNLTAGIDDDKLVSLSGSFSDGPGHIVNIRITDPAGALEYADSLVSGSSGRFECSYNMINDLKGKYVVSANAFGAGSVTADFSYGTDNTLKSLTVNKGGFDKAFAPGTADYTVAVDSRVENITVTPTVSEKTATVTVNGTAVASGTASPPVALSIGENTITIVVTSASGKANTYTITVDKADKILADIEASASITSEKTVAVSGTISAGAGHAVTMKIVDPKGELEYIGETVSTDGGKFAISYSMVNGVNGRYTAAIGAIGVALPETVFFDYFEMKDIKVSGVSLKEGYRNDLLMYTAYADDKVESVTITPTAADNATAITVNSVNVASGTASLPVVLESGINTFLVAMHGADGTSEKTFTVMIGKDVEDTQSGTVEASLEKDDLVKISGTIGSDANRQVSVMVKDPAGEPDYLDSDETGKSGRFEFSYPLISKIVGDYFVTVNAKGLLMPLSSSFRYSAFSPDLSGLAVSEGSLSPAFDKDRTSYTTNVKYAVDSIAVTATAYDETAEIKINGSAVKSGEQSDSIHLKEGYNSIRIVVTTVDNASKTYTVAIIRELKPKSSNALLAELSLDAGTLTPAFSPETTDYQVTVPNDTDRITLSIFTADAASTFTVNGQAGYDNNIPYTQFLDVGINEIKISVKAQDGKTTKTYTVAATRAASGNADLKSLSLSAGSLTPAFSASVTGYTANVGNDTTSVHVTPTPADASSTVSVNGTIVAGASNPISLASGDNQIEIKVTAQNGDVKTYTLTVKRAYSVNLSGLTLKTDDGATIALTPAFQGDTENYTASVSNGVAAVTVTAYKIEPSAVIRVNGVLTEDKTASGLIGLSVGVNHITVKVTAPDETSRTYKIQVNRAGSGNTDLSSLTVSKGTLSPAFDSGTRSYQLQLGSHDASVIVTPVLSDSGASIVVTQIVDGIETTLGSPAEATGLSFGSNNWITVKVTSPNGLVTNNYTIQVTRPLSADATLSGLTSSSGSLTPEFDSSITNYTVNVANSVSGISLTPIVNDSYSSVTINGKAVVSGNPSENIALSVGSKTIPIKVTAQSGASKTYNVTVVRAASDNADLGGLALSSGALSPAFASNLTAYTAAVANDITNITVTPAAAHTSATVKVNGTAVTSGQPSGSINLDVGANIITVAVTAQDGTVKTYSITVTRAASNNADLGGLALSSGALSPAFVSDKTAYTAAVANNIASITVKPTTAHASATVTVNGTAVTSGQPSGSINLDVGANIITVAVTAEDNSTEKTYSITVTRAASDNADLSSLTLSSGTLSPAFASNVTAYTAAVANNIASITVKPTTAHASATVTVNGTAVTSGQPSGSINLDVGANTITVAVTAQDGTVKTYSITVTRAASDNADLMALNITGWSLAPLFDKGTYAYTLAVGSRTELLDVIAVSAHNKASININGTAAETGRTNVTFDLGEDALEVTITVTAEDGETQKTYTVSVTREPDLSNSSLSNLELKFYSYNDGQYDEQPGSAMLIPIGTDGNGFMPEWEEYSCQISDINNYISVIPTGAVENITNIKVSFLGRGGSKTYSENVVSGTESTLKKMDALTAFEVEVTAFDGSKTTYTIILDGKNTNLYELSTDPVIDEFEFDSGTTDYYGLDAEEGTYSLTVTATAFDPSASVEVKLVAGGDESTVVGDGDYQVQLVGGCENKIMITVSVGGLSKTYSLYVLVP